jgi:hypothetical protein
VEESVVMAMGEMVMFHFGSEHDEHQIQISV